MSESRKTIPIVPAAAPPGPETEIQSCAELEPYALRVIGDSMAPEFLDGHVIVLDPGLPATHGAYVVAEIEGETIFRQFWIDGERKLLKPLNADYPAVEFGANGRMLGVVTQRAGKRRAERKRYD